MAAAAAILLGWALEVPLLRRGFAGSSYVRPNTAVALFFAAVGVLLLQSRAIRFVSLVPLVIGGLTLAEYLFDHDLGIDALLFSTYDPDITMRMSLRAAISSTLAGFALLLAQQRAIAQWFALATAFVATLSVVAYLYGAQFLPRAGISPIALSTSILFLLWSVGFLARTSRSAVVATLLRPDQWGDTTRRVSVVALIAPGVFGAICLMAAERHIFDVPFAVAIVTAATSLTLIVTILRYTSRLRDQETDRIASDALYRTIVETSQEGICVIDAAMHFTFVNERLANMLGYTTDELIGKHVNSILPEEERAGVEQRALRRRADGTATRTTVRLIHRNGSLVHAISSATEVAPTAHTPGFLLATLADISDRVAAEGALRASESRFRSIYDSNLIGVGFWTFDGSVIDANDAFLELFSVSRSELPGWKLSSRNLPDAEEIHRAVIQRLLETGRCEPFEEEFVRPDGSHFFVILAIAAIDLTTNIVFAIDTTERAEARRQIERAHEILSARLAAIEGTETHNDPREIEALAARLAEANAELETFSYSVSHDLRAPLRAIDGFSRELQTSYAHVLDAQGKQYLKRVRMATQRMSTLIDDLLSLSRLSTKTIRRSEVDVTTLAREVAAEAGERSGRAVAFDIQPDLTVSADPHLLRIVLENIIGNAVKFSSRRENPCVELFNTADGELAVRDNGAGFDPQYADKIFAPFQRLHTTEFEGTGIGLALVQRIVRRHGGTIRAESTPGEGATFYFTLSEAREIISS